MFRSSAVIFQAALDKVLTDIVSKMSAMGEIYIGDPRISLEDIDQLYSCVNDPYFVNSPQLEKAQQLTNELQVIPAFSSIPCLADLYTFLVSLARRAIYEIKV